MEALMDWLWGALITLVLLGPVVAIVVMELYAQRRREETELVRIGVWVVPVPRSWLRGYSRYLGIPDLVRKKVPTRTKPKE